MQIQQSEATLEDVYTTSTELRRVHDENTRIRIFNFPSIKRTAYCFIKRLFDLVSASCLLIVISPIMLGIAIAIKRSSEGPAFYKHKRIGRNGKEIYLWKFRSMVINADELFEQFTPEQKLEWEANFKLKDDPRITKIGAFLRRTSLDELPQLLNIIKGELSVIGPRPVVDNELEKYGFKKSRFLSSKPGLTGHWQVNGRSTVSYEDRMEMELYYIENASFKMDAQILWKTFAVVFNKTGAF